MTPVVAITGASAGIGRACAEAWSKRGARVVLNGRRAELLEEVAESCRRLGGEALPIAGDVTSEGDRRALIEKTIAAYGRLDVLVNNAGQGLYGTIESLVVDVWSDVFALNVFAPIALVRLALPHLRESRGSIVMMSSIAGLVAVPRSGGYAATKFALEGASMALRAELAAEGSKVRVHVIRPGLTETDFARAAKKTEGRDSRGAVRGQTPQHVAEATVRAVERGTDEVNLTAEALAIGVVARVSRPVLHLILRRLGRGLGVAPRA